LEKKYTDECVRLKSNSLKEKGEERLASNSDKLIFLYKYVNYQILYLFILRLETLEQKLNEIIDSRIKESKEVCNFM
jgi:hypothetical protein